MLTQSAWFSTYVDLGDARPPRRRCVTYRALANHMSTLPLDASRDTILARLAVFPADDPTFWRGLLVEMEIGELPADADWLSVMETLCGWLKRENPLFVEAIMMDWLLEEA